MGVLRKLFGPGREQIWRQLSTEMSGHYVDGGMWKGDKVEVSHGEWTITLDTYVVSTGKTSATYTRMRAPYVNPDGFRFTVYRRGFFSDIAKALGMQDIEVGHEAFDRSFIIKANDEAKGREVFWNDRIRELVMAQPHIRFAVKDGDRGWFGSTHPDDVDELSFVVTGVIKDLDRLKQLYELFAETLDQLTRMGSAYERAPEAGA